MQKTRGYSLTLCALLLPLSLFGETQQNTLLDESSQQACVQAPSITTLECEKTIDSWKVWQLFKPEIPLNAEEQAEQIIKLAQENNGSRFTQELNESNPALLKSLTELAQKNDRNALVQALLEYNSKALESIDTLYTWDRLPLDVKISDLVKITKTTILNENFNVKDSFADKLKKDEFANIAQVIELIRINKDEEQAVKIIQETLRAASSENSSIDTSFDILLEEMDNLLESKAYPETIDIVIETMKSSISKNPAPENSQDSSFGTAEFSAITVKNAQGSVIGFAFTTTAGRETYSRIHVLKNTPEYDETFKGLLVAITKLYTPYTETFYYNVNLENVKDQEIYKALGFQEESGLDDEVVFINKISHV